MQVRLLVSPAADLPLLNARTLLATPFVWIIGAIVALGPLSLDLYLPSLPALQAHFGADTGSVQRTVSSYFLGLALGQVVYGSLADRYGRKLPLVAGLVIYAAVSFACAAAPGIDWLIGLRFLQALGACAGIVITRAIVRDRYAPQQMAQVLSVLMLIMGVAPILAPMLGGYIFLHLGWEANFLLLGGYGTVCALLVCFTLPETLAQRSAARTTVQTLRDYARILGHRRFLGYALAGGTAQAGMYCYIALSSFVFIEVYGVDAQQFSWIFGANAFGLIAASQLNHRLLATIRAERVLRGALRGFTIAGFVTVLAVVTGFGGLAGVLVPLFVCIATLGLTFPNSTAAAMAPFGDRAGMASAVLGTLQFSIAGLASGLATMLHDGTALPMAGMVAACGAVSLMLLRGLVREPAVTQPA
jgi:DHA1 family bicyclomycin/chloramphenicol resistance-like MFS transporter